MWTPSTVEEIRDWMTGRYVPNLTDKEYSLLFMHRLKQWLANPDRDRTMEPVVFELEVDVVLDRSVRPWKTRVHYVTVAVTEKSSWMATVQEARNLAAYMCWHVRGNMVTAVRVISCEI